MKKLKLLPLLGLCFPAMMLINGFRFQYGLEDAFWRTLMMPFEGTIWAPGFKEAEFLKVREGMKADDVFKMLGEPIRRDCGKSGCFWIYTWQDTPTADFDQRWVMLNAKEQVTEIRKGFFID